MIKMYIFVYGEGHKIEESKTFDTETQAISYLAEVAVKEGMSTSVFEAIKQYRDNKNIIFCRRLDFKEERGWAFSRYYLKVRKIDESKNKDIFKNYMEV